MDSCRKLCDVCQALYVSHVTDVVHFLSQTHSNTFQVLVCRLSLLMLCRCFISLNRCHTLWALDMPALWVSFFVSLLACRDGVFCNLNVRHLKHELYLEVFPCSLCEA